MSDVRQPSDETKRRGGGGRLALLALVVVVAYWFATRPAASRVTWVGDFDEAAAAARSQDALLLVDFWADWCGPCRALDARVFSSEEVEVALGRGFVPVRIDLSSRAANTPQAEVAARYAVVSLPTVLVIDPRDGSVIRKASDADLGSAGAMVRFLTRPARKD